MPRASLWKAPATLANGTGDTYAAAAGPRGGPSMLETFDANGDGSLLQAEVDQFRADRLAKFDIMATDG